MLNGYVESSIIENDSIVYYGVQSAYINVYEKGTDESVAKTSTNADGSYAVTVSPAGHYEVQASYIYNGKTYFSVKESFYFNRDIDEKTIGLYIDFGQTKMIANSVKSKKQIINPKNK